MIASSHLVLFYPFPSFSILWYSVLYSVLSFIFITISQHFTLSCQILIYRFNHFYSRLLEVQMYLPREDRTISTVWQKKWGGEKEKRIKIKLINRVIYLNWVSSPISLLCARKFYFHLIFLLQVGRHSRLLWLLFVLFYLISSLKIMQLYSTLLSSTLLYSTLYSTLSATLLSSPLLYSTLLYTALLYSTLLYTTLLYSTLLSSSLLSPLLNFTLHYSTLHYTSLLST